MTTTYNLKPLSTKWGAGQFSLTGAATNHQALSDNSDASSTKATIAAGIAALTLRVDPAPLPVSGFVVMYRSALRFVSYAGGYVKLTPFVADALGNLNDRVDLPRMERYGAAATAWRYAPWKIVGQSIGVATALNANPNKVIPRWLQVFSAYPDVAHSASFFEAWLQVVVAAYPSVAATAPAGTVADPSPDVEWTHTSAEGAQQAAWAYAVYDQATADADGFTPVNPYGTVNATYGALPTGDYRAWDFGPGASASTPLVTRTGHLGYALPTSLPPGNYRLFVWTAETTAAGLMWAPVDESDFAVAVDAPPAPRLLLGWDSVQQAVAVQGVGRVNLVKDDDDARLISNAGGWGGTRIADAAFSQGWAMRGVDIAPSVGSPISLALSVSHAIADWFVDTIGLEGSRLRFAVQVHGLNANGNATITVTFKDAGAATISTATGSTPITPGDVVQVPASAVVPAGTASIQISAGITGTAAGGTVSLRAGDLRITPVDGGSADVSFGGYESASTQLQVEIDGTWFDVRRILGETLLDDGTVAVEMFGQAYAPTDYEAPRGGTLTYRARTVAVVADVPVSSDWEYATVATVSDGQAWLKAVEDPSLNTVVSVRRDGVDTTRGDDHGVFSPLGATTAVAVFGTVRGRDGTLTLTIRNAAQREALEALAGHSGRLLLQEVFTESDGFSRQRHIAVTGSRGLELLAPGVDPATFIEAASLPYVEVGRD